MLTADNCGPLGDKGPLLDSSSPYRGHLGVVLQEHHVVLTLGNAVVPKANLECEAQ